MATGKLNRRFVIVLTGIVILLFPVLLQAGEAAIEKELQAELVKSRVLIKTIIIKQENGSSPIEEIKQLKSLAGSISTRHQILLQRFTERETFLESDTAKSRHLTMFYRYQAKVEDFLDIVNSITQDEYVPATTLDLLQSLLESILPKRKRPLLGSLPYRHLSYNTVLPDISRTVVPAYKGGDRTITEADLAGTSEAPITTEIAQLAESLNWNPVEIYEWVKNNISTEWYWGMMKGAEETLLQKSGNDADQAALLVALLRSAGYPARYIHGVIDFIPGIERLQNLTGIEDPRNIARFFQKAGIPVQTVVAGGRIANLQIEHIWVESYIPYANYRGAIIDEYGKTWLGLDTSIKAAGYSENTPSVLPADISLAGLREDFLSQISEKTPMQYLRDKINASFSQSGSGLVYDDLLKTRSQNPESLQIVPAGLQFNEVNINGEYTAFPENLKHAVRFVAHSENQQFFDITLNATDLSNRQVAVIYEPETIEDQEIINSYAGLFNTPSYLVHLRPVLTVNGFRMAIGQGGMAMGADYSLDMEIISPHGTERIENRQIMGNVIALGIASRKAIVPDDTESRKNGLDLLQERALSYIDEWNRAENELAALLQVSLARPIPTIVTTGSVIDVTWLLDTPHGYDWKGVFLDADLRSIEVSDEAVYNNAEKLFMQLSSLQGSVLEHKTFEDGFGVASISTAKLLQLVNAQALPVHSINSGNIDTVLPELDLYDNVREDIINAVNQGLEITIPEIETQHEQWLGTGYIKENIATGEAGYMLSGMIAGGMSAISADQWPKGVAEKIAAPLTNASNDDPSAAVKIYKVLENKIFTGTVGQKLLDDNEVIQPLQVYVTDDSGYAVEDVPVTFTLKAGGGLLIDPKNPGVKSKSVTVQSSFGGIAEVYIEFGEKTSVNPAMLLLDPAKDEYYTQVDANIVNATLPNNTSLIEPFTVFAAPGPPVGLEKVHDFTQGATFPILSWAGFVSVAAQDTHGNPVSNVPITFTMGSPVQNLCIETDPDINSAIEPGYLVNAQAQCITNLPTYATCASEGVGSIQIKTNYQGARVELFTGEIPGTTYPVTASMQKVTSTVEFSMPTSVFGNCDLLAPPDHSLMIGSYYQADLAGNSINAGKVGSSIPVKANMYFISENEEKIPNQLIDCADKGGTDTCDWLVGNRTYTTDTNLLNASLEFDGQEGTLGATGVFTHDYKLGDVARKITVRITGNADKKVNKAVKVCADNRGTCQIAETDLQLSGESEMMVYAVDIQTSLDLFVPVDAEGYVTGDYNISYEIKPAEYKAGTAHVLITEKNGSTPVALIAGGTSGSDTVTLSPGFKFDLKKQYFAEVVLNYQTGVQINGGKVGFHLSRDKGFPKVALNADDYYPALGTKRVLLYGEKGSKVKFALDPEQGTGINTNLASDTTFNDTSPVEFTLNAPTLAPSYEKDGVTIGTDAVTGKFLVSDSKDRQYAEIKADWKIRNNYNVTLGDVLDGRMVFVYDEKDADNHKGFAQIKPDESNKLRKFNFVQELLNQVVPRKRAVTYPQDVTTYELLEENGIFDTDRVAKALETFRKSFGRGNTVVDFTSNGDKVHYEDVDNTSDIFRKFTKDYGLRADLTTATEYLYKVIDKNTLVGENLSATDTVISALPDNPTDTGLYELYANVIKPFVNAMIAEAKKYADYSDKEWYDRGGIKRTGVSYSYGGKQTVEQFGSTVATQCPTPTPKSTSKVKTYYYLDKNNVTQSTTAKFVNTTHIDELYNGVTETGTCPSILSGGKMYPGLVDFELRSYNYGSGNAYFTDQGLTQPISTYPRFNYKKWAGIDCSGLVQWAVEIGGKATSQTQITIPNISEGKYRNSQALFDGLIKDDGSTTEERPTGSKGFVYRINRQGLKDPDWLQTEANFRKGDLLRYKGHVSMVYSDKSSCNAEGDNCEYEIVHASGDDCLDIDGNGSCSNGEPFNRKVVKNSTADFKTSPTGYGRIKLWD